MSEASTNSATFAQNFPNINLLWAALFIEELVRNNIHDFCIAPGSRSTPLTLAAASHKQVTTHVHFDERGLGFFALGLSLSSQKPVVIITTSGTALANLYPAVIEAKHSAIPLIILSADRPPELLNCGANQAIDQHAIFANYPVFFRQIPSPTLEIKPNYLLTTVNQGLVKQKNNPAPIHFNLAFSEPLYPQKNSIDYQEYLSPLKQWSTSMQPFTCYIQSSFCYTQPFPDNTQPFTCGTQQTMTDTEHAQLGKKAVIIVGRLADTNHAHLIAEFAKENNYPLLADIQSSLISAENNLSYYDLALLNKTFQAQLAQADIIIQFGDKLISKRLTQFIEQFDGEYWLVKAGEQCIDPDHLLTKRFAIAPSKWIAAHSQTQPAIGKRWLIQLNHYHQKISQCVINAFLENNLLCEINVVDTLDKLLPSNKPLFIGNSMPIRVADMFMKRHRGAIFSNRGASGIDGLLATAVGVAKSAQQATTLLIGDTSFIYDLNSLALLKQLNHPFVIIVINNDGGSIFNLLPVPSQQKQEFYQLPHGLTFADTCKQFSIDYYKPNQPIEFKDNYRKALKNRGSLIEISVKNAQTSEQLAYLKEQIKNATF